MYIPPEIAELVEVYLYPVVVGFGGAVAIGGFLGLRRRFNIWRHKRALARNPDMSLEEEREYLWRIDEAEHPPMLTAERLGAFAFQLAPIVIGLAVLWTLPKLGYQFDAHDVVAVSFFIFMGVAALVAFWKKLNDPPEGEPISDAQAGFAGVPTDAVHGAVAAGGILLILVLFWWFTL